MTNVHSASPSSSRLRLPLMLAMGIVVILSLATRLPAPWKLGLINDEQHHLKSWRNRYGTDDIYPLFLQRLHATGQLKGKKLEWIERIYHSGPLAQRALICLVDPQPPLFPVLAETIEYVSNSSLIAIRIPSMLASLASIFLMYRIGRIILARTDQTESSSALPLWLAGFSAIAFLPQTMAGFGRPYALTQCALLATIYFFLKDARSADRSPARVLILALITQSLQWMTWSIVGPLVIVTLCLRRRAGISMRKILLRSSWYFILSGLLLCEMFIQLRNPTISQQGGMHSIREIWSDFCIASPFANLAGIWASGMTVAGILFAILMLIGAVATIIRRDAFAPNARLAILLTLGCSLFAAIFIGTRTPFWMTYGVPATIVAAIGVDRLLGTGALSAWTLVIVLIAFGVISIARPADPYVYTYPLDTPWAPVAQTLRTNLKPGDAWTSVPYNLGNNLYVYGPLPEPDFPQTEDQFVQMVQSRSTEHPLYVVTWSQKIEQLPVLNSAAVVETFRNNIVLLRLPPR